MDLNDLDKFEARSNSLYLSDPLDGPLGPKSNGRVAFKWGDSPGLASHDHSVDTIGSVTATAHRDAQQQRCDKLRALAVTPPCWRTVNWRHHTAPHGAARRFTRRTRLHTAPHGVSHSAARRGV